MFPIVEARSLAVEIKLFRVQANRIARKWEAGQFVIIRVHEHGERIPLTIADVDTQEGTITLVVQGVGKTTQIMNTLQAGDSLLDVVGPLGRPSEVGRYGTVVVIGGGVGVAIALPVAAALRHAGNRVIAIVGARDRARVILEDEIRAASDEVYLMTDDGSYGGHGLVTEKLDQLLTTGTQVDRVLAVGPIPMMNAVAERTSLEGIKTVVSLNSIMIDGTGMCGGCRVLVGGRSRFTCVDGPEFDAHEVDFEVLARRNAMYRAAEREAVEHFWCPLEEKHPELKSERAEKEAPP